MTKRLKVHFSEGLELEIEKLSVLSSQSRVGALREMLREIENSSRRTRVDCQVIFTASTNSYSFEEFKGHHLRIVTELEKPRELLQIPDKAKIKDINILLPNEHMNDGEGEGSSSSEAAVSKRDFATIREALRQQVQVSNTRSRIAVRADTILLFVCLTPDDAEAAVGDLIERFDQVRARKSWRVSLTYFYWELLLLTVTKAKKRLVGATIGPLLQRLFAGSS